MLDDTWYTEQWAGEGSAISLELKEKIHDFQSPYQRVEVFETTRFGRLMTLDGLVMVTERDEFVYHEMLVHPAMFTHAAPRRVLIIGGGDCGTLREVLRHDSVQQVDMVELDQAVTEAAALHFPTLHAASFDPRARLYFQDGITWVADAESGSYDVILIDSTDPVGPAQGLFSVDFYRNCQRALATGGVLAAQSESPLFHADLIRAMRRDLKTAGFADVATVDFPQCTYPSGWWSVTIGARDGSASSFRGESQARPSFATRYYNPARHRGALAPAQFMLG
ncbi:polyamine aminopropyltransferase [Immundisolibacter sp.]